MSSSSIKWACHFVGGRDGECAKWFIDDMASRIANRIQLTSDGHKAYLEAVEGAFGADIDYAMLNKIYGSSLESAKGRYSPAECIGCRKEKIEGAPDMKHVSTSYAERANLTAMEAGLSETVMSWADFVEAMDADVPAKKRGPYKRTYEQISN